MNQPLFSVIIPCYNYGHLVGRAISSVLAQDGDDYEIVVVNDGSTDDSESVVACHVAKHPRLVHYEYQENRGPAAARNTGIRLSKGRYLILLDADDEMVDGALTHARHYLVAQGEVDVIIGSHITVNDTGHEKVRPVRPLPDELEQRFLRYLKKRISMANGAMLIHRRIFDLIKYNENLRNVEDIPVFAHMLALYDCRVIDAPIARIYKHSDSLRHNTKIARKVGLQVVDVLFDKNILPSELFKYRRMYYVRRCLSLFRIFYFGEEPEFAKYYYCKALKSDPRALLEWSYLRKYLRMRIRMYYKKLCP